VVDRRAPIPPPSSEGERLLRELDVSGAEVARAIGVSKQSISNWRCGSKAPNVDTRRRLEAAFPSVRADAWEQLVGGAPAAPALAWTAESGRTLDDVLAVLRAVQHAGERPRLTASETAKLAAIATDLLKLRVRIDELELERAQMDEEQFIRGARWARFKATLRAGVAHNEVAARIVDEALRAAEAAP
jgi:transcriptional regulator with XRE-family HTH domain